MLGVCAQRTVCDCVGIFLPHAADFQIGRTQVRLYLKVFAWNRNLSPTVLAGSLAAYALADTPNKLISACLAYPPGQPPGRILLKHAKRVCSVSEFVDYARMGVDI